MEARVASYLDRHDSAVGPHTRIFRGLLRGVLLARPKVTTFGAGCDPCPGLPRCCASPYCCCRAARAALRTATGNGNRERAGALNPLSWAAGASAAGRLPCLASPFFGGDSKAACRRLASQLAAHSATMGRSAISHGELAALLVDGEASMPSAWLYAPFEQQQSARSSTKPPSPLFAACESREAEERSARGWGMTMRRQ